jgi:hypothetical protein
VGGGQHTKRAAHGTTSSRHCGRNAKCNAFRQRRRESWPTTGCHRNHELQNWINSDGKEWPRVEHVSGVAGTPEHAHIHTYTSIAQSNRCRKPHPQHTAHTRKWKLGKLLRRRPVQEVTALLQLQ